MIKRYNVIDAPTKTEIIAISNLKSLKDTDFLLIRVNAANEDELNDFIDQLGAHDLGVPTIVTNMDSTAHEIVEKIEGSKE